MLIPFQTLKEKYNINPKTLLHIGASHGEERDAYRDGGVSCVLWVEAIPEIFEKLKENIKDYSGHYAINACIHETAGLELELNVSSNDGQSSSIFEFGTHAEVHPDVVFTHKIKVKTRRADEVCNADGLYQVLPDMVNLDIQGAELLALKSMSWLGQVKYVYTEVNSKELYVGCALIEQIDEYLLDFGFERVETVWAADTGWGDAFYINRHLQGDAVYEDSKAQNESISDPDYEETNTSLKPTSKEQIIELIDKRDAILEIGFDNYIDGKSDLVDEIANNCIDEFKKNFMSYEVDFIIETLTSLGQAPNLVYDDNGWFAVCADGFQPVVTGDEKIEGTIQVFVAKEQWKKTIREALLYYLEN